MTDVIHQPTGSALQVQPPSRAREAAAWAAARLAAGLGTFCGPRSSDTFGILTYHRVAEPLQGIPAPTWSVTPRQLRKQLSGLLARGFEAWPLSKLIDFARHTRSAPRRAFAVTFDDGYANNLLAALPVLAELRVPATLFLATGYLDADRPFPFDDWIESGLPHVPREIWRPLTTSECRQLLASGLVELGAHTHTHQRFVGNEAAFREDLERCVDTLLAKFGVVHPPFALPYGASTPEMIEIARQSRVSCCLSTRRQLVRGEDDPFTWGRFDVAPGDSPAVLAAKLSGWYSAVATTGKRLARPLEQLRRSSRRPPTNGYS